MGKTSHSGEDDPAKIAAVSGASEQRAGELDTASQPEPEVFICRHVPLSDAEPRAVYPTP